MLDISDVNLCRPSFEGCEQRLNARLQDAQRRASELNQAVLVRLHVPLEPCDPWTVAAPFMGPDTPFFWWNDGRMGLCAAAVGALSWRTVRPAHRFADAKKVCAELLEQVLDVSWDGTSPIDVDAPLAFAGFAFGDGAPAGVWAGWAGGAMVVAPLVVYRREHPARTAALINMLVDADTDTDDTVAVCVQQIEALQRPVDAGLHAHAGEGPNAAPLSDVAEEKSAWVRRVEMARQATGHGPFDKLVLARRAPFAAPVGTEFDPQATLHTLRREHPASICFAISRGDGACFLGATPEILVQVLGRSMVTQAVAGTAPRGRSDAEDAALAAALVDSAKDRSEHAVVADVLQATLQPMCMELQRSDTPRLIRLPRVQHLETPFHGTLREAGQVLELVERLHPTPSVGGWPAADAQAWLRDNEDLERGYYAGPVGWVTAAGDGAFAVAIRSVLMTATVAHAFVGAGIVPASDPQAEWQETELKLRTVSEALELRPARLS